jgi:hypothetical protein
LVRRRLVAGVVVVGWRKVRVAGRLVRVSGHVGGHGPGGRGLDCGRQWASAGRAWHGAVGRKRLVVVLAWKCPERIRHDAIYGLGYILGYFFIVYNYVTFDKNGLGYILGDFFTNSSGHLESFLHTFITFLFMFEPYNWCSVVGRSLYIRTYINCRCKLCL